VTITNLLLVAAVVLFLIAALLAFGVLVGGTSVVGLIACGLALFAAAHLPI
jgi:hypothetical protein